MRQRGLSASPSEKRAPAAWKWSRGKKGDIQLKNRENGQNSSKLGLRFRIEPMLKPEIMPMNSNQIVANSLTEALTDFQKVLAPLLELGKVEQWDGISLLHREEKIREAALILAGKCIAILLKKLANWQSAQERAVNQTLGWWRKKTGKNGSKEWEILTVGNVRVTLKLPYVVERSSQPRKRKKPRHQGFCPFLRWLGLEKRVTPLVWSTLAEYGTMRSSFETAQLTLKDWGIDISIRRIQSLTYSFCQQALSQRRSKIFHLERGTLPSTNLVKGKRVVISVDGGRSRLIDYQGRKRNKKTSRRRYKGEWKEPKLLTIYAVDKKGKKIKTGEVPITNDGTFENSKELLTILEMYLVQLGIKGAQAVLFIADGAEWMWKDIPPLLKRLGCDPNTTYYLQDFYHVTEHLSSFAEAAFDKDSEKKAGFKKACKQLKGGKSSELIQAMISLKKEAKMNKDSLTSEINHLVKLEKAERINYHLIAELKLPLGSGAIESLIRQAVNLRLKGNGKFWRKHNAEGLLHARCQWLAGGWSALVDSILTHRIYPLSE